MLDHKDIFEKIENYEVQIEKDPFKLVDRNLILKCSIPKE